MKNIDWTNLFDALDQCVLCVRQCKTGTAKAEHMRKHVRENRAAETDSGFIVFEKPKSQTEQWIEVFRELETLRDDILPEYREAVASLHQKGELPPETTTKRFHLMDAAFKDLIQKLSTLPL